MFHRSRWYRALLIQWCLAVIALSTPGWAAVSDEPILVVVTIPVLKDLVEQVGGSHVQVTSLLRGHENEHTYSPKPSHLVAVRKARLLFEVGSGLEVWVSNLIKNAGSTSLTVVTTSRGVELLQDGAGHGGHHREQQGNPHIWLDPVNAITMTGHITDALVQTDPSHREEYQRNRADFLKRLERLLKDLDGQLTNVADKRLIVHHPAWPYFARRFGFQVVATIQAQSGSEPSARHLQYLINTIKSEHIKVIVSEIQLSQKLPHTLAKETGARVVLLTTLPGGIAGTETYLDMLRYNVLQLVQALEAV